MKLQKRLSKVMAVTAVATTLFSAVPVFANDYNGHWAEATIASWKDKGIIDGYEDGSFKPKQEVTRAELAKMVAEVFGLTSTEGAEKFADVPANLWYAKYVSLVSAAGLMTGTEEGNFRPNEKATREEAAYALATAYHVTGASNKTFKDAADISEFAVDAVEALVAGGYINGYPDGTFQPQGSLTRAEMVTMLDKITAEIYNVAGTYTQDTAGNVVVNVKDVVLKDMTINGNLYLAEGIGEGDVTLDGVTVTGDIIVEGGGISSVHIKGKSQAKNIVVSKAGTKPVRLAIAGTATITGTVELDSNAVIEGTALKLGKILVNGAETVEIKGTVEVEAITVAKKTTLTLTDSKIKVKELTINSAAEGAKLDGRGIIEKLTINAEKVSYAAGLAIRDMVVAEGLKDKPKEVSNSSGGGGGGGGGGTTGQSVTAINHATVNLAGEKSVKIDLKSNKITVDATGKNVVINDVTFEPTMAIESASAAANGNNVTVSVVVGTSDDVTLQANKDYTIADLAEIVNSKRAYVDSLVDQFHKDGVLVGDTYTKAKAYVAEAFDIFNESAQQDSVDVASIQHYIRSAKAKIAAHGGVDRVNKEFKAVLDFVGATLTEDKDGVITATFTIEVKASNHKAQDIQVTLVF